MPDIPRLDAPLSDGHIALREWREADADAMTAEMQDPEIARWTRVPSPYTREHALSYLRGVRATKESGEALQLAIVDAVDGELLGSTTLRINWEHLRAEIGTVVFAHARGRQVSSTNGQLLALYGIEQLGLRRVEILAAAANTASVKATIRRARAYGWETEGVLRSYTERGGRRMDMIAFSLIARDLQEP